MRQASFFIAKLFLFCAFALPQIGQAQFDYEVYDGSFDNLPDFSGLTPIATGQSSTIDLSVTSQSNTFALVFTHTLTISTAGDYEFRARSDDGSKILVNGTTVVDNDGLHAAVTVTGSIYLVPGSYPLRVEFFEKSGGEVLEVSYRTENPDFQPIPSDGVLSYTTSNKSVVGEWGAVIPWPEIAISAANLPDGRVLTWSSTETNAFPSGPDFTHASVFDPVNETFVTVDSNFHDMFCAGISTLEDGTIVASGGNPYDNKTSSFDPTSLTWSSLANMNDQRWYGSNITLGNNTIFSTFAKQAGNRSEVYDPATNIWALTPNATMQVLVDEQNAINTAANPSGAFTQEWWSHIAVTPQGDVFQGGPTQTWHRFDPVGGSANVSLGQPIGDTSRMYGNVVTYDAGKVLLVGGGDRRLSTPTSVNNVYLVDLNGASPVITSGAPMNFPRALSNTVTLPNGEVLVIGGNTVAKIFSDEGSVMPAEIYTPSTDSWRIVDSLTIPRNYHSTALLLKDGRVLSAGGGACGGCSANHIDGQIYSPPYLFNPDGSAASRPTLSNVASQVVAGEQTTVDASNDTTAFSMVRLSGTTHHMNTDQRHLPVSSVDNGDGTFSLTFHANPNVLIPGNYWLFAVNANGTPSIGTTLQVIRSETLVEASTNGDVYISDIAWVSEQNGLGSAERDQNNGGSGAGDGSAIELNGVQYEKGVGVFAYSEITIDLAGQYKTFLSDIGLDDAQDGLCGDIRFEVDVDGVNQYSSGSFTDTTTTASIAIDTTDADSLTLKVLDNNSSSCGDVGNWANARLVPEYLPGFRYYRFNPTKLRDDASANSIQMAEFALFYQGTRLSGAVVTNPSGNNPGNETPDRADDNITSTKWLDFNKGALVYDYDYNRPVDSYSITTANDHAARDPVRWLIEGSKDGVTWFTIDDQTAADFATPTARFSSIAPQSVVAPGTITELPEFPRNSTTLLVESYSGADRIWNVNPDNDTVSVSDDSGSLLLEIAVGDKPWALAKQPAANKILVTNKGDASITVIDTLSLTVDQTIALARGSQPHGIVFESSGSHYYVVLETTAKLEKRNSTTHAIAGSLQLSGTPRHLSMAFDNSRLFVSNFITPPLPGESTASVNVASAAAEIFAVVPSTMTLANTVNLTHDNRSQSESQGPGMPNYLGAATVSFDDQYAYVPSKKDNIDSGVLRGKPGMTFESTVRANTSRFDLATESEDAAFRVDLDNSSVATHAALSGDNRYLFVTLETSRELAVYDTVGGFELMRLPVGRAPQSVALSSDGSIAYVHNFMDRSVSRLDLTTMLQTNLPSTDVLSPINVVSAEQLSADVLLGKQHFYDAADDRLALDDYMSCASCHKEGKHDGRVWDLSGMGEGLRKTISLVGKGSGHGILHWSGNFDEVQDFENQIRTLALGSGLMSQGDFANTSDTLGAPKAGLSPDLDALAAYVNSLTETPVSPHRPSASSLSADAQAGKSLFTAKGCIGCHTADKLTDSSLAVLHDVGTIDSDSGSRLGGVLAGFDTPGLIAAWSSGPYLHDGSAATLDAAIVAHSAIPPTTTLERNALVSFIREAEPADTVDMIDTDGDGVFDFEDVAINNGCIPNIFVAACTQDTDGDGVSDFNEGEFTDTDSDGQYDYQESLLADEDIDGTVDQDDPANSDACIPAVFVAACAQDSDADGTSDFDEGELVDTDGDGLFDYQESSLIDADSDGLTNQFDPANANACAPNAFVVACNQDTDGDGITDFNEGSATDTDGDGLFDYQESMLADTDSDGSNDQNDAANNDPCIPSVFVSVCAQDSDGDGVSDFNEGETTDSDGDGLFDYQESSIVDTDSDGVNDQADNANADACIPSAFNSACLADSDGDGVSDFNEGSSADTDSDGILDYLESSIVDSDSDGVNNQADPANDNACLPSVFNAACSQDTDGDGISDFNEGQSNDSDGDGLFDYQESLLADVDSDGTNDQVDPENNDACLPNQFVSACSLDTDGDGASDFSEGQATDSDGDGTPDYLESSIADSDSDGTTDQLDSSNADACIPNVFVAVCAQDTDGDGVSDFNEGQATDTDGDGLFDYQESSLTDSDNDGTSDQLDSANADACIPNIFIAACAQDTDGDGVTDFNEGELSDSDADGLFDYQESSVADTDSDGIADQSDPENNNACLPNIFNSNCATDTDGDGVSDFNEGQTTDTDSDGLLDYQESLLSDMDSDGSNDQNDPSNNDPCLPTVFVSVCTQDSDGDGTSDFNESQTADSDSDGNPDYLESSLLDTDSDGVNDQSDAANGDACIPSVFNSNCATDTDSDGVSDYSEGETADTDGDGLYDYLESSLTDSDNDGTDDQTDPANANACIPNVFIANCGQDSDGDGTTDFNEGESTDTDSDGLFDYQESSLTDSDSDGINDQDDPANNNPCLPSAFVSVCTQDTDGDGATDFSEGESTDTDGDGLLDYQESSIEDDDSDGSDNQNDPANSDPCLPNAFVTICTQDTDGDGVSDFDEGESTDTDSDGLFDYQESSVDDADSDGVTNQDDPANTDPCIPSVFNINCSTDSDGDGVSDFDEGETSDTDFDGTPDYLESSITDSDSDGTDDQSDPANNDACSPSAFVSNCYQDTDGDGATDYDEGETIDTDGDGLMNYVESSILDNDNDTFMNESDPDNDNACIPEPQFCTTNVTTASPAHHVLLAVMLLGLAIYFQRRKRFIR